MTNEIAKQDSKQIAKTDVGQMDEFQPMSGEDTIRLPRLILVQGGLNNAVIKEGLAKDGDLINSLSKDNYGQEIEVVPLLQQKSARIRWTPRDAGGGILCIARDGENAHGINAIDPSKDDEPAVHNCSSCPLFNNRDAKTGCSSNYQIVAMVRDTKEPIILTGDMTKASDRGIKDLFSMAVMNAHKGYRMFQRSYILKSTPATTKQYNYYRLTCLPGNKNMPLDGEEAAVFDRHSRFFRESKVEASHEPDNGEGKGDW